MLPSTNWLQNVVECGFLGSYKPQIHLLIGVFYFAVFEPANNENEEEYRKIFEEYKDLVRKFQNKDASTSLFS